MTDEIIPKSETGHPNHIVEQTEHDLEYENEYEEEYLDPKEEYENEVEEFFNLPPKDEYENEFEEASLAPTGEYENKVEEENVTSVVYENKVEYENKVKEENSASWDEGRGQKSILLQNEIKTFF